MRVQNFFARYFSQQSCLMVLNRTDWCEFAEFSCNTGDYIHSHFFFITVELCFSGLFLSLKRIGQFSSILLQSGPVGIICLLWSSLSCLTPLMSFLSFQVDFFNLWRHLWAFFFFFFLNDCSLKLCLGWWRNKPKVIQMNLFDSL